MTAESLSRVKYKENTKGFKEQTLQGKTIIHNTMNEYKKNKTNL